MTCDLNKAEVWSGGGFRDTKRYTEAYSSMCISVCMTTERAFIWLCRLKRIQTVGGGVGTIAE